MTWTRQIYCRDQVPTEPATIEEIMAAPEFALGVADARAERPYRDGYQAWTTNKQWGYERGRAWAKLTPVSIVLKRDGKITREAITWFERQLKDIL